MVFFLLKIQCEILDPCCFHHFSEKWRKCKRSFIVFGTTSSSSASQACTAIGLSPSVSADRDLVFFLLVPLLFGLSPGIGVVLVLDDVVDGLLEIVVVVEQGQLGLRLRTARRLDHLQIKFFKLPSPKNEFFL